MYTFGHKNFVIVDDSDATGKIIQSGVALFLFSAAKIPQRFSFGTILSISLAPRIALYYDTHCNVGERNPRLPILIAPSALRLP